MDEKARAVRTVEIIDPEKPKRNVLPIAINEAKLVLVTEECYYCGVVFGFPLRMQVCLKENQRLFYCPNGHSMFYPKKTVGDIT